MMQQLLCFTLNKSCKYENMPTPIAHTIAGLSIAGLSRRQFAGQNWRFWLVSALAANAPDVDFLFGFIVGNPNKYHHQFTHSITFGLLLGFLLPLLFSRQNWRQWLKMGIYFFILISSHLGLDFVTKDTSAPYGEMLLWPVTGQYYISPIVIFSDVHRASTAGDFFSSLFNQHNLRTVILEFIILVPVGLLAIWLNSGWSGAGNRLNLDVREHQQTDQAKI